MPRAEIDDTYAEAFRSLYAEVLITARDRRWLNEAVRAATGNASSTILCDCEAGLDRYVGPGGDESFATPDGRPGAVVQFHLPRFRKDRVEALERAVLVRVSQNVMTCPTCACFNVLTDSATYFKMGRKVAFFGDGHQFRETRFGRKGWVVPILSGEFFIERRIGYRDGLMGGNLWFFGATADGALEAADRAAVAASQGRGRVPAVPGRRGGEWFEGRQPLFVYDCEHLCGILPDAARETRRQIAIAGGRRIGARDHHQRPRLADDREGHAGGDRGIGRDTGANEDFRRQLWREIGEELRVLCIRRSNRCETRGQRNASTCSESAF